MCGNKFKITLFIFSCVIFLPLVSQPSSVRILSSGDMITRADLIVQARVIEREPGLSGGPGKGFVATFTKAEAIKVLKGAAESSILIRTPGGRLDGQSFFVPGSPVLKKGGEYIFFLTDSRTTRRGQKVYDLIGLGNGSLPVIASGHESLVMMPMKRDKAKAAYSQTPGAGSGPRVPITIESLEKQIQAVLKNNEQAQQNGEAE